MSGCYAAYVILLAGAMPQLGHLLLHHPFTRWLLQQPLARLCVESACPPAPCLSRRAGALVAALTFQPPLDGTLPSRSPATTLSLLLARQPPRQAPRDKSCCLSLLASHCKAYAC